ncbi:MAG: SCO family protein [Bacteroidota bacterium]
MTRLLLLPTLLAMTVAVSGCQPEAASASPGEADAPASVPLPFYADETFTPHWFETEADVPATFHAIPAFALTDQQGRTVTEADLDGSLTVANFFFTSCPGICPMATANMKRVQEATAGMDDVILLSHSVTPETDSVATLAAFADRMGVVAERWHLVTGPRETIYALGKGAYFADEDRGEPSPGEVFTHTESFYLLDGQRRIRGIYNGMNTTAVTQLLADIEALR